MGLAVHLRGLVGLLVFLFLVKEENNVGNVGNVAQSEKSPQKSQQKVFRKGNTAYIAYINRLGRVGCHAIVGHLRNGGGRRRSAFPMNA